MASKHLPPPVETIGNYNLLEQIGSGSMGSVYKAQHWESQEIVAIKITAARIARNPVLLKRFEQEFRIARRLEHPNIVRVLEYCVVGETPFLVMEYVEGESVGKKLERMGRLPEEEAVRLIIQVSHGLHRAHRLGLVHRDVKPDNIMITPDGRAKILDLGLAKELEAGVELTRTGAGLGTPNFMAPEQFRNAKNASVRCDIYSLAATLYMMVTGELPFGSGDPVKILMRKLRNELPSPRELVPELSERTDWTIKRALSAAPEQRPASCREFAEDLIGQSTRLGPPAAVEEPAEWYMIFPHANGSILTATGSTRALRRSILEGHLGKSQCVRASRNKSGPFELLVSFPEFRDLVVGPAPGPPLSENSQTNLGNLLRPAADPQPTEERSDDAWPRHASGGLCPQTPAPLRVPPLAVNPSAARSLPPTPAVTPSPVSARTPPAPVSQRSDWWKLAVLVILTALTTLAASHYLLPFLQ
jgi:serine/threonine protein kinase